MKVRKNIFFSLVGGLLLAATLPVGAQTDAELAAEIEAELAGDTTTAPEENAPETANQSAPTSQSNTSVIDRANMPNIWVIGDFTSDQYIQHPGTPKTHIFRAREMELGFNTAIDHLALGQISLAAHNEDGAVFAELHEMFLEFNQMPWNLQAKFGRMFPDVGRLNSMHLHSRPFTYSPIVHEELFHYEGIIDTGGELSWLVPWGGFYQELKVGLFNGRIFGHAHNDGFNKPAPLWTARLKHFVPLVGNWGVQFGGTSLVYSPTTHPEDKDISWGADARLKWKRGRLQSFELAGEFWYRQKKRADPDQEDLVGQPSGFYVYANYQPFQTWYFGARYDYYSILDRYSPALGKAYTSADTAQSVWVTWQPSEFSYYRLTGERRDVYLQDTDEYRIIMQVDFTIGYHPAHEY